MLQLEKDQLLQRVSECENDNKKFDIFKREINDMKRNLNDFKEETAMWVFLAIKTRSNYYALE